MGRHGWWKRRSSTNRLGKISGKAKEEDQGALALVLDLVKAIERVSLPVGLGNALQLPKEDPASAVRVFRAPEACIVRERRGGAAPDHHGHALTDCVCRMHSVRLTQFYPPLKLRVFLDDIISLVREKNREVVEVEKKVMKKFLKKK